MDMIYFLFRQTLLFSIPLLVVALGGMFSERSGVVNIALEGIMIFGAFVSIFFIHTMQNSGALSRQTLLIVALIIAGVSGILLSLLHAFAAIHMKADQTISGTALNLFAPAFGIFMAKMIQSTQNIRFTNEFRIEEVPVLSKIPVIGDIFFKQTYITTYLGLLILAISAFVLYKTRFGLRLRACGENPQAVDSAGISVYKIRYAGVLISGLLGGIGGLIYIIPISTEYSSSVAGYGFLALAVLIFGQWRPLRILMAAFFFGFAKTIANAYSGVPFLLGLGIPKLVFQLLPYAATLVLLAFTSKNSAAPRASGEPYDKSKR